MSALPAPLGDRPTWGTVAILCAVLILGYLITRVRPTRAARVAAWALVVASVAGVERLDAGEPAGVRMLAIIGTLLFAMKAVVAVEARATGGKRLAWWRWLGFAALWPGMRPGPFARPPRRRLPGSGRLLGMGLARLVAGPALVALARLAWVGTGSRMLATALLLPGLSLVLHFGLFNLLAGAWRRAGVDCRPLFVAPLAVDEPGGVLGTAVEPGLLPDDGPRDLPAPGPPGRAACGAGRVVPRLGAAARAGHQRAGAGGLRPADGLLRPARGAGDGRAAGWRGPVARSTASPGSVAPGRWPWLLVPLPILFHRPFLAGVVWPLIGIHG